MAPFDRFRNNTQPSSLFHRKINILSSHVGISTYQTPFHPIGLYNMGANCAYNALIQFMAHIPSFIETFEALPPDFNELKTILRIHLEDEMSNKTTSRADSQKLREMMHRLFKRNAITGEEIFSASPNRQEDANEILMCILSRLSIKPNEAATSPLFSTMITTRRYEDTGVSLSAEPEKLLQTKKNPNMPNTYSILDQDSCSRKVDQDCQVILDLKNKGHLTFEALFHNFFFNRDIEGSADAFYLKHDDRLHQCRIKEEIKEFVIPPQEMLVVLKRFDYDDYANRIKINTPIAVPLTIELPAEAVKTHQRVTYELDGFVQHIGERGSSGHYVAYSNINGKWIKYNDKIAAELSLAQIQIALQNPYFLHYRRINPFQIPQHFNTPVEIAQIPSIVRLDLAKAAADSLSNHNQLDRLKEFLNIFNHATFKDNQLLIREFYKLPSQMISTIHFLVWVIRGLKDVPEYGKKECDANVLMLKLVTKPWISIFGNHILEQLLHIQEQKLYISNLTKTVAQLEVFLEMLKNPKVSNEDLKNTFYKLEQKIDDKRICDQFHGLVYRADPQDQPYYGQKKTDADVRILLNITQPMLSLNGSNLVEQMICHVQVKATKAKYVYLKEQLESFYKLLNDFSINNNQLQQIFETLDPDIKEKLYLSMWIGHGQKDIPNYGKQIVKNYVRSLLALKEPILGSSGGDIVQQLIHLMEIESARK